MGKPNELGICNCKGCTNTATISLIGLALCEKHKKELAKQAVSFKRIEDIQDFFKEVRIQVDDDGDVRLENEKDQSGILVYQSDIAETITDLFTEEQIDSGLCHEVSKLIHADFKEALENLIARHR